MANDNKTKKKKLKLSVSSKKPLSFSHQVKSDNRKSVVIEKKVTRRENDRRFYNRNSNLNKSSFGGEKKEKEQTSNYSKFRNPAANRNREIRKKAEERATKRFTRPEEENLQIKKSNLGKNKNTGSKREYKLTISKALEDEGMERRERSLASVRRARLKEKKKNILRNKMKKKLDLKK